MAPTGPITSWQILLEMSAASSRSVGVARWPINAPSSIAADTAAPPPPPIALRICRTPDALPERAGPLAESSCHLIHAPHSDAKVWRALRDKSPFYLGARY